MIEEKAAEITTVYSEASSELTKLIVEKRNTQTEVESLTTQKETLTQEIDELSELKISADEPIPLFRIENAQLKQQLSDKDGEIERARQDQAFMHKQLQRAERTAASCEQAHSEVTDLKAVLPREYEELLRRARTTKAAMPHKLPAKFGGNSK